MQTHDHLDANCRHGPVPSLRGQAALVVCGRSELRFYALVVVLLCCTPADIHGPGCRLRPVTRAPVAHRQLLPFARWHGILEDMQTRAAVILGAGWSVPAGLPLASALFDGDLQVGSLAAYRRISRVQAAYETWAERQADPKAEIFLRECYESQWYPVPWPHVVEYVQARLASPIYGDSRSRTNLRYGQRVINRTYCRQHENFWLDLLQRVELSGVITTNYDLLAERSLRHRAMKRPPLPGFYYAGLPKPQTTLGQSQPWTVQDRRDRTTLTGTIPLAKLHGSLNWAIEDGKPIIIYQDTRAAFRRGGTATIVPPIPEKQPPALLTPVWDAAQELLTDADVWIVVGYSLPEYDRGIRDLFNRSAGAKLRILELRDPYAEQLQGRWKSLFPRVNVLCLPGIT